MSLWEVLRLGHILPGCKCLDWPGLRSVRLAPVVYCCFECSRLLFFPQFEWLELFSLWFLLTVVCVSCLRWLRSSEFFCRLRRPWAKLFARILDVFWWKRGRSWLLFFGGCLSRMPPRSDKLFSLSEEPCHFDVFLLFCLVAPRFLCRLVWIRFEPSDIWFLIHLFRLADVIANIFSLLAELFCWVWGDWVLECFERNWFCLTVCKWQLPEIAECWTFDWEFEMLIVMLFCALFDQLTCSHIPIG